MKRSLRIALLLGLLVLISSLLAAATPGAPPVQSLTIDPASWNYGNTTVGSWSLKTFAVTYSGKGTSGPLAIGFGGTGFAAFANTANDTCTGTSLSWKTPQCSVEVQFAPSSPGSYSAWLSVDGRKVSKTATLTGTGQAATLPSLSIDSPTGCANCGPGPYVITFTVSMSHTSGTNVTFNWAATDDSATWGTTCDKTCDYTSTTMSGNGTITAGSTSTTIVFGLCDDGPGFVYPFPPIKFTVTISNATGATIATDTGTGELRIS